MLMLNSIQSYMYKMKSIGCKRILRFVCVQCASWKIYVGVNASSVDAHNNSTIVRVYCNWIVDLMLMTIKERCMIKSVRRWRRNWMERMREKSRKKGRRIELSRRHTQTGNLCCIVRAGKWINGWMNKRAGLPLNG